MNRALNKRFYEDQTVINRNIGVKRVQNVSARKVNTKKISFGNETRREGRSEKNQISVRQGLTRQVFRQGSSKTLTRRNFKIRNKSELWFAGFLFMILLAKLFIRVSIIETSYKIETARNDLRVEDAKLRELKVKMAMVANPKELSQMAASSLALRPTLPQQIRRIKIN